MPDVTTVTDAVVGTQAIHANRRVWTSPTTCYLFYRNTGNNLVVRKSTDRGATFGAATQINTAAGTIGRFDIWKQRWTPTRSGVLVLTAFDDGGANIKFRAFDTSDDSLGAETFVVNRAGGANATQVRICEARGGQIGVAWDSNDATFTNGFAVSGNGGASFAVRANPYEVLALDTLLLVPGNETDPADFYAPFHDTNVSELMLKHYDDSANSWSETLIATGMGLSSTKLWQAVPLLSDNHIFLPMFSALFLAGTDLRIWEITNPSTIVERTNILTNTDESFAPVLTIDQNSGRLYVAYSRGTPAAGSNNLLFYKTSDDRGVTWSPEIQFSDVMRDTRATAADLSIGDTGGRWQPGWYQVGGTNLFSNTVNDVEIGPGPPGPDPIVPPPPPIVPPGGTYGAAAGAPAGTILYITPDGIQYPLVTPHVTGRFVMSFSGFGTAPIQYITQRGPNQDGESVRDFNLTPRVVQLLERQQFKGRGAWWDGRADILNDLRPNRQLTATAVVTGALRIVTANGDVRDLNVFIQDGPRFEARNVDEWDEWAFEEVLRFIAHDPLWFNPARVDFTVVFALDADLVFPITFDTAAPTDDIIFGAGQVDVSVNLDYVGTWASLPTIVIVGPLNNLIIDNVTTGETLSLLRNIAPGRTVTIDLAFGQKTIVDDLGNNLLGSLSTDSDLGTWHIAPTPEAPQVTGQPRPTARNVIRLRGSAPTGATSVQIRYFTRYFGI